MSDTDKTSDCSRVMDLLARWQTFSELQQRAFAFLASEAVAAGEAFEHSTDGATRALTRMADGGDQDLRGETWAVVHKLQAADRSRQGLEQVASVLTTLRAEHAALAAETRDLGLGVPVSPVMETWITALSANVSLADWRRRLVDALHGREPSAPVDDGGDEELF